MNLVAMRTLVRRDLHDEDEVNRRWTDAELDRHIGHALEELSRSVPLETECLIPVTDGDREFTLSTLEGFIRLQAVEYPIDSYPPVFHRFDCRADKMKLLDEVLPEDGYIRLYYSASHTMTEENTSLPSYLEDLVAIGAEGFASLEWAVFCVNRVNSGGTDTPKVFEAIGRERLVYFRNELRRLCSQNKVRVNSLFTPAG
ncbi:hypothetical protein [Dehalococcoides mccartyi]|uniref:phage adaptor protein n=1 Tax=Dehalococcoides mccartyi TaxID=61435 RepID=UPI0006BC0E87|nr:hypothetical protein [Dehalococcoides mccartyi]BAS31407.1 hypothetical protein IBK_0334 [Dehalococcoides mccartyi IBARAKI]